MKDSRRDEKIGKKRTGEKDEGGVNEGDLTRDDAKKGSNAFSPEPSRTEYQQLFSEPILVLV